jgi:putative ABC transport system ATP-binding protein
MLLELRDIYYCYGKNKPYVLSGITAEFQAGTVYAIMGGSGSGKTTLLSLLAYLDQTTEGDIFFKSENIKSIDENIYRSRCVSVIFQHYNLLPNYSVYDNIITMLKINMYSGDVHSRVDEILDIVSFPKDKRHVEARLLSGGEQQRVAIARALASDAEVILADEPTGNLDDSNAQNIMKIFMQLKEQYNKCIIIVTHSGEIAQMCDMVYHLENGCLMTEDFG